VSNSPLERGCAGMRYGGGVLADIPNNTPLHPSQEGNRTVPALLIIYYNNSPLERGRVGMRCGGGVLADIPNNTPLHPSQEGNRTARALFHCFPITKHLTPPYTCTPVCQYYLYHQFLPQLSCNCLYHRHYNIQMRCCRLYQ